MNQKSFNGIDAYCRAEGMNTQHFIYINTASYSLRSFSWLKNMAHKAVSNHARHSEHDKNKQKSA